MYGVNFGDGAIRLERCPRQRTVHEQLCGSALGAELGRLTRWLNDVLALGEFIRAAREAHEVSSPQCQMTEASKANATALREALLESTASSACPASVLPAACAANHVIPRTGPCPRQPLGRSGLRTAGRVPAAVAAGRRRCRAQVASAAAAAAAAAAASECPDPNPDAQPPTHTLCRGASCTPRRIPEGASLLWLRASNRRDPRS